MKRKTFVKLIGAGTLGLIFNPVILASSNRKKTNHAICKKVWEQLCGKIGAVYNTDVFEYVKPIKRRPNVLIYGDSISIEYSSIVRELLKDKATVIRLFKNGGSSNNVISNLDKMYETMFQPYLNEGWNFKWDVIHFNVGLHDLKYLKGKHLNINGKQVSTLNTYKENLNLICKYLKKNFPKAKLIFATTTPVPEGAKGREKGDSIKYNAAALEVLARYPDIIINDLYSFTKPHQDIWAKEPGNVHYNKLGSQKQGMEVVRIIKNSSVIS